MYTQQEVEAILRKFADKVDDQYRQYTSYNIVAWNVLYGYNDQESFINTIKKTESPPSNEYVNPDEVKINLMK
jgi:hypothetical protein